MTHLKTKANLFLIITILVYGCTFSHYRVLNQSGLRAEIDTTPDRVITKCEKISPENELYMFTIHVLDDQMTVLTALQGNNSDLEDCLKRDKTIKKILRTGQKIYLAGMGYPTEPREMNSESYYFPNFGSYYDNGRVLQLMYFANENNQCYAAYHGEEKPCPRDGFPINDATIKAD